jgi:2-C-methyl-D-erythritol 4-phosphate cytidylyltransferase
MDRREKVGAVILAAGESRRMNGGDKLFVPLGGKPVLAQTVNVFEACSFIDQIVLVMAEKNIDRGRELVAGEGWSKVSGVYPGGARRQDSVAIGLGGLSSCRWIVIHDGARPLVREVLIKQGLVAARETGAAAAAIPVTDTIKIAGSDRVVRATLPRHELWSVQTPQVFRYNLLTRAHREVKEDVTDDAAMLENIGQAVKLYPGDQDNIKITVLSDLVLVEALWQSRLK